MGRHVARFTFSSDGWRRAASGEWQNVTGHQRMDLKGLARLSPEAPLKMRAWTSRGEPDPALHASSEAPPCTRPLPGAVSKALCRALPCLSPPPGVVNEALGGALPCLSCQPGAMSKVLGGVLRCLGLPPGMVRKTLGGALPCLNSPPGMMIKAQGRALPCLSHPPNVVSEALGWALPCLSPMSGAASRALSSAGTAPGAGSTESILEDEPVEDVPCMEDVPRSKDVPLLVDEPLEDVPLEDNPLEAEGEVPLVGHYTASPVGPGTEAHVPPGFLQEGPRGKCRLKGPSLMVMWAWVLVLLLAWHQSLQGKVGTWTRAVLQTVVCLMAVLPMVCWMWRCMWQELEAQENDIDFLGRRIPFLRKKEMCALDGASFLGSGGNACARYLLWGGAPHSRTRRGGRSSTTTEDCCQ
ncbi:hypothetical protein E2C01_080004 [Portunus trituberculatus]|uniref:Uncharacterized protein n=1 Tax=Portunus trituberculatus TaxID=210409 RepID=A0A5B7ISV0_PORTR|nr:hypothetical protein [Portunus trituberculatus]